MGMTMTQKILAAHGLPLNNLHALESVLRHKLAVLCCEDAEGVVAEIFYHDATVGIPCYS